MLESPLAPYLLWAKTRQPAAVDLLGSNLAACSIDDLPDVRRILDITAPNDNGYGPLVESIAAHYDVAPDRVVPGAGCSGANFVSIAALVGAGDDVLIERPGYDPLIGACRLMGANVRRFDRRFEEGYRLDLDAIRARLTPRTRLVVLTTPHNPSGCRVPTSALAELGDLMAPRGWVLVDEVYLDLANLAAGRQATAGSAARLDGPFIVTSSLTKSYGLAGLKCGWTIASANNAERLRRTRDVVENSGSAPADLLGAHAFEHLPRLAERATDIIGRNITRARAFMGSQSMLQLPGPIESSVMFPRLEGSANADGFAERLLEEHDVAVAPGSFFGDPANIRVSLAGPPDQVAAGLERLSRFLTR
jgi:aspartate/methionine/tyrosine aminotransferase